jgi:hypothetical protein
MATTMNRHSDHLTANRTVTQKVCIGVGIFFIIAGLGGIVMPGLLGMHLSLLHNLVHLASGALALWVGYGDDPRKAYTFSLAFGVFYGLLGIVGFLLGGPGYPGVGHMESDDNLLRVIPNVFELGTMDHIVHLLLGVVFIGAAYAWKKRDAVAGRSVINEQGRTYGERNRGTGDVFRTNSQSDLKDAELGRSDINRPIDRNRRDDYESRI